MQEAALANPKSGFPIDTEPTADVRVPALRCRRAPGRLPKAYVWHDGRRFILGDWGSEAAAAAYRRFVAAIEPDPEPEPSLAEICEPIHVDLLGDAYIAHARETYRKRGSPTSTIWKIRAALELLYRSGLGEIRADQAGPVWLKRFQSWLADHPEQRWSRNTINEYVRIVVEMFRWGVSEQVVPPELPTSLDTVKSLRKNAARRGREHRDGKHVGDVDRAVLQQTRRRLPRRVRIMVNVQMLTGMRPSEVCCMRPRHITPLRSGVWVFAVPFTANKTEHLEISRQVFLGPRCMRLLRMVWPASRDEPFFSPRKTQEDVRAARAAARKTPRYPSHDLRLRRKRRHGREELSSTAGEIYTPTGYRQVIERACRSVFGEDAQGRPLKLWTPNQLRHTRATVIANRVDLLAAKEVLGHRSIETTMRYVRVRDKKAIDVAARCG